MEGLTEGRMVHVVLYDGRHRAAVITEVVNAANGLCSLSVFLAPNDPECEAPTFPQPQPVLMMRAHFNAAGLSPITWHWIERA